MKKKPNFIIHFFMILAIFFFIQIENIFQDNFTASAEETSTPGDELTAKLNSNNKISCEKTKKKIQAAIELYMVENGIKNNVEIFITDLLKSKILKFEPACPEGGKYKINKNIVECLKCDKPVPPKVILPPLPGHKPSGNLINGETDEVTGKPKEKIIAGETLEASISKYIDREDTFILDKTEKTDDKKTNEVSITKKSDRGPEPDNTTDENKLKAEAAVKVHEPAAAEAKEQTAEQIQPETPVIGKSARDFHQEAIEHARKGEIDKALDKFKKAIELVPDSFTYHYNYGLFLAKIESFDLSYIEFQRALRLKPDEKKVKDMIEKLKKAISFR